MNIMNLRDYLPRGAAKVEMEVAVVNALNEEARKNSLNSDWVREQATVIGETIDENFSRGDNPFSGVINTEQIGVNDTKVIKLRRGVRVFAVAQGGSVEESNTETDAYTLGSDTFGWHITVTREEMMADWTEALSDLHALANLKEEQELLKRQYDLMDAAITNVSAYYVDGTGGLTKPMLDTAITDVMDAPRYEGALGIGSNIKIIGRASTINQITDMTGFVPSENEKDYISSTGFLGKYKGCQVTVLHNMVDEDDTSYYPEGELWVVSGNAGQFVLYGGSDPNGWVDPESRSTHIENRRRVGGLLYQPQVVRRIALLDE